jgi:transcriptional regulator with XRE-family HTH domain
MDINTQTANKIKEIRTSLGITAKAMATELGIAETNYSLLEKGKVQLTLLKLQSVAEILKVPLTTFIDAKESGTFNVSNAENSVSNNGHGHNVIHYCDQNLSDTLVDISKQLNTIAEKLKK